MTKEELQIKMAEFRNFLYEMKNEDLMIEFENLCGVIIQMRELGLSFQKSVEHLSESLKEYIQEGLKNLEEIIGTSDANTPTHITPRSEEVRLRQGMRMIFGGDGDTA